jgi:dTDP-4-dehydrorhamnose reductase
MAHDSQPKTILITGGSGFVGQNLARFFVPHYSVVVADRNNSLTDDLRFSTKFIDLDITDADAVLSTFDTILPEVVIHAAGNKNVRYCEEHPEEAYQVNALGTNYVADACRRIGARMIYLSTDLVFGGDRGNYQESDLPVPSLVYGKTKLQGEQYALRELSDVIICRSGGIYGKASPLLRWLSTELEAGQRVDCFTDVINTPTYVENLAEMMEDILQKGLHGIFHTVGRDSASRFQFFQTYAKTFGFNHNLLQPIEASADRAKMLLLSNSSLSIDRTRTKLEAPFNSVSEGFARLQTQGGVE